MIDKTLWASVGAAALIVALGSAAQAQNLSGSAVNFDIDENVEDVVEDINEDVEDDFDRDLDPFGNEGRELGFQGSVALRATGTTGNSESSDIGIGASFEYFDGQNGSDFNFAYTYSDDGNSGDDVEENLFFSTDYTRELGRSFYGFAKGVAIYDNNSDDPDNDDVGDEDEDEALYRSDIFVGVGVGYRISNTDRFQWSVQAGPGYRWYEPFQEDDPTTPGDESNDSERIEEVAASVTSNFAYQFSPTITLSNDTDVITSDENTSVLNDLALSVALNESLSLRTSVLTEYQSEPGTQFDGPVEVERDNVDNTLGVAVVYSF
ncbi:DUF481 domain-containing protein [Rubellimicrobium rubrum]|uniref:DUF481 domain-containing protein n=1 Tax=Rubellimicrobium rubrum TaxID=2585369 RepID=A0A5C4MTU5_9RHOB|nr:DUF481 domain-containing protein [Rubellimicrobium rubrum]TNC48790.1 DUF481 domain-containing protein [Rubellimicrobium rubrum]